MTQGLKLGCVNYFVSSGQLVIVDIMLGHYTRVERPMERGEDIIDITTTDKSVVLYNNKYYRSGVPVPLWPIKSAHLCDYLIKLCIVESVVLASASA